MDLIRIYQCFCDPTRLRILNLLLQGPLCVCHLQDILKEPQVKISKHLLYLRARGLVEVERCGNWMIYALPVKRRQELETNLKCLQDCTQSSPVFVEDLKALTRVIKREPVGIFNNGCFTAAKRQRIKRKSKKPTKNRFSAGFQLT